MFESLFDIADRQTAMALHPKDQPGIDAARTGCHHESLHRGEPHGGVDRAPECHRGQRGPGAEVRGHQAKLLSTLTQQLAGPSAGPGVAEPVEAETSNVPPFSPFPGHCVSGGFGRHIGVKACIKAGDLRKVGPQRSQCLDGSQTRGIVQGRQVSQRLKGLLDVDVEENGFPEGRSTMDHSVSRDIDLRNFLEGRRRSLPPGPLAHGGGDPSLPSRHPCRPAVEASESSNRR